MSPIYIDRNLNFSIAKSIELVGYCDASMHAYGAVLYIRAIVEDHIYVNILCSKSRLVPLNKSLTIPRLELNSALLLCNVTNTVYHNFKLKLDKVVLYSDSNIVLAWIKSNPLKLNPYVANRVTKIQELTYNFSWLYINTKTNPADYLSRGSSPENFAKNFHWFKAPEELSKPDFCHINVPVNIPNNPPHHYQRKERKELVSYSIKKSN